jgi:F-type H+-transporting ATPase subunit b
MKRSSILPVALAAVMAATPAYAADEGLPQFNTALYPEQLFWLAVSFAVLYLLMKCVALPSVEQTQDKRKQVIDDALNAARTANEQAKAMGHEADKALSDARAKAQATISGIKTEAARLASDQQATQAKQLHARLKEAEGKIFAARDAAVKEIEGTASGLAADIVKAVAGQGA